MSLTTHLIVTITVTVAPDGDGRVEDGDLHPEAGVGYPDGPATADAGGQRTATVGRQGIRYRGLYDPLSVLQYHVLRRRAVTMPCQTCGGKDLSHQHHLFGC